MRRATEKSDKRRDKDAPKPRRARASQAPSSKPSTSKPKDKGHERDVRITEKTPGRYSGVLGALTIVLILMQATFPQTELNQADIAVSAFAYVILGYFMVLWLLRRRLNQAMLITVITAMFLSAGVEGLKFLRFGTIVEPLLPLLSLPATLLGGWLGQALFRRSQAL